MAFTSRNWFYTFSLCENASLIIVTAETEYISTRSWYRNINFLRDRIRRILYSPGPVACFSEKCLYQVRVITVFTVFRLLTDFVCVYTMSFDFPFVRLFEATRVVTFVEIYLTSKLTALVNTEWLNVCYCFVLQTEREDFTLLNSLPYPWDIFWLLSTIWCFKKIGGSTSPTFPI
jgi:hypothetical protein